MGKPARDRVPAVPQTGEDRIAAAFALRRGRAALMPYLMGGFPDMATSRAIGEAYAANGADLVELGVPFSDPLADGPTIHAAGTAALSAGATIGGVLEVGEALAKRVPVVLMCYVNLVLAPGADAFVQRLRDAGISGLIVPDLPLGEEPAITDGVRRARRRARAARRPDDDRRAPGADRRPGEGLSLHGLGHGHDRGARQPRAGLRRAARPRQGAHRGAGRARLRHRDARARGQAARAGADGVIVGTRLVRAAAESDDPAAATGELVAQLAAGLIR